LSVVNAIDPFKNLASKVAFGVVRCVKLWKLSSDVA
jgi:hypothetical protein